MAVVAPGDRFGGQLRGSDDVAGPLSATGSPISFWGDGRVEEDLDGVVSHHPWDVVYIAGIALPGICEVKPTGVAGIEIDKKKPKGAHGATITLLGYDPRTFDINCKIWTAEHWSNIQQTIALLWKGPKAVAKDEVAIAVRHPSLQLLKIDTAVLIGLVPPVDGPEPGTKVITFRMHEKVNTKKAAVKSPKDSVTVVTPLRNSTPPENVTSSPPGADRKFTGPGV